MAWLSFSLKRLLFSVFLLSLGMAAVSNSSRDSNLFADHRTITINRRLAR